MWQDPIVKEVRSQRAKIAEKFGFDLKKIVKDAQSRQNASGHKLVSFIHKDNASSN